MDLRGLILSLSQLSFKLKRPDFGPERADLGPDRVDLGLERGLGGCTNRHMDRHLEIYRILLDIGLLGPQLKKGEKK